MKGRIEGIHIIVLFFLAGIIFGYICVSYNYAYFNFISAPYLLLISILYLNKNLLFSRYCKSIICLLFFFLGATNYSLFNDTNSNNSFFSSADKYSNLYEEERNIKESIKEEVREKIIRMTPNKEERSILLAITLGDKSILTKEQKESFSNSGAMHILALSGLHIGILFTLLQSLLFCLNFSYSSKRMKSLLLFICILFYGYITGFSASVQRAIIMIIIYYLSKIFNRKYNKVTALSMAAFIIITLSPTLLFTIGFQLSFAAIIGIFFIYPTINSAFTPTLTNFTYIKNNKVGLFIYKYFWNTISLSIACQITTLPLCLYYFGSSSNYFIITNLLAIPLATSILYLFVFSYIFFSFPYIGAFFTKILIYNIKLLNYVVDSFN